MSTPSSTSTPVADLPLFLRLDGARTTAVLDLQGPGPALIYFGARLGAATDLATLSLLQARQEAPCSPARTPALTLSPLPGAGFPGRPGVSLHRDGRDWALWPRVTGVEHDPSGDARIESTDEAHGIAFTHGVSLAPDGDMLVMTTRIRNTGEGEVAVEACDAPALPLPGGVTHWTSFEGRWSGEMQTRHIPRFAGALSRENRRGRTSHDAFPGLLAETDPCGELSGEVYALHLGWSGNHRLWADTLSDGRAYVQMGELFGPGEMRLAQGESYVSPALYCAWSDQGRSGAARAFHAHVRRRPQHDRLRAKPRPVHYNTWEAVYFDHKPDVLMQMADQAAAIGVERFVLDDGWFPGRRNDRAGLGDWTVDPTIYPQGLAPLARHVQDLGMEFGLWFEPEMVNPDSDLFRAHPDWVLAAPPAPQLSFRHQLVLDFSRADVRAHIHGRIDALLRALPIAYIKWDMNRDLSHPGGADGRMAAHAHVRGLYAMLDQLRRAHPGVEIETCASGGGRADLGVLERTDRVWTSDTNDALDRLAIQRGLSTFLPAELMGAHVGPTDCHITGRRVSMATRVSTALFGHFGIEADLRVLTPPERETLAAGVALYKTHRALIHSGDLYRLDRPEGEAAFGIVSADKTEALFSFTQVAEPRGYFTETLRLAGLAPDRTYRVELVWPHGEGDASPVAAALRRGLDVSGDLLLHAGLQPPRLQPQEGFLLHLRARDARPAG